VPYRDSDGELGESPVEGIVEEGKMKYGEAKALLHRMYEEHGNPNVITRTEARNALVLGWAHKLESSDDCCVAKEPNFPKEDIIDGLLRARFELGCEETEMLALSKEYNDKMKMRDALDAAIEELSK